MLNDLVNLPKYNFYIKLMIDGVASRPFSAKTIPPPPPPEENFKDVLVENSRHKYGTPKLAVEEKIAGEWMASGARLAESKILHKDEHRLSEILKPEENKPLAEKKERPKQHDRPDKKKVDIADLRKALADSLTKNFGDEQEVTEEPKDQNII